MTGARTVPGWRSGFCSSYPHADWQRAACHGGHSRTPTKADPRDSVPCICECHQPEEPPVPDPTGAIGITPSPEYAVPQTAFDKTQPPVPETYDASLLPDPGPPLPIAAELVALAAERLSEAATGTIEGLDWEDCIRLLDLLRDATHAIGQVDSLLVRQAYLRGPHGDTEVDGIGVVKIQRGKDRKNWEHRAAAFAVLDAHLEERAEGGNAEVPPPSEVVEWILAAGGFSYWRVTALRALGLPVEEFCEELPGNLNVQLPPRS